MLKTGRFGDENLLALKIEGESEPRNANPRNLTLEVKVV
jgi:hypothetical protein